MVSNIATITIAELGTLPEARDHPMLAANHPDSTQRLTPIAVVQEADLHRCTMFYNRTLTRVVACNRWAVAAGSKDVFYVEIG